MKFNSLLPELTVSDINISREFYLLLGFKIMYERKEDNFIFIEREESQLMLQQGGAEWRLAELSYPYGNGINFQIEIKGVKNLYEKLSGKVKMFKELFTDTYNCDGVSYTELQFIVADPDGYLLRFSEVIEEK